MKIGAYIILILVGMCAAGVVRAHAGDPPAAIARLLDAREKLKWAQDAAGDADPKTKAQAIEILRASLPDYHDLRTGLEPGKSVFDYPGLLGVSSSVYFRDGSYRVFLGVFLSKDEPEQPFFVTLDRHGIIHSVRFRMVIYD